MSADRLRQALALPAPAAFEQALSLSAGRTVIAGAVIQLTSICQIQPPCRHCRWRSMSKLDGDYWRQKGREEVLQKALAAARAGIRRVHLPSGWVGKELPEYFYEGVREIRDRTGLAIYGFSGAIGRRSLRLLKEAGATGYFCGIEVANESLSRRIRPGESLESRLQTLRDAKEAGLRTWSGLLYGVGESEEDLRRGLELMRELEVDEGTIFPFRPWPFTEMERRDPANLYAWSRMVAILRVYLPRLDILTGPDFAPWVLRAGANGFFPVSTDRQAAELREMFAAVHAEAERAKGP